jgi:hypothetical protein
MQSTIAQKTPNLPIKRIANLIVKIKILLFQPRGISSFDALKKLSVLAPMNLIHL